MITVVWPASRGSSTVEMAPVPVTSMNMFGYTVQPYSDVSSSAGMPGSTGRCERPVAVKLLPPPAMSMPPSARSWSYTSPLRNVGMTATSSGCTVGQCRHSL